MADLSQAERDKLPEEDFAGPDRSYPITDQDDVDSAAHLIGKAADPAAVKAKVIAIAKRKGLKLPDAWAEGGDDKERADQPTEQRNEDGVDSIFFLPITRIDQDKREVEGVATSEAVDTFGTVFDYEASKAAFAGWAGNVREMHQPKAVGRKVDVRFDDDKKQIVVRARISKGAEDTWQKILDGTLSGYSIGGRGAVWQRAAEAPPRCTKYDLVELSIVDQASNPDGRGLTLYRADAAEQPAILDDLETPAEPRAVAQADTMREGRTISAATREKLHGMRDAAMGAAKSAMDACGCDDCQAMAPKGDGDDDADDRLSLQAFTRALDGALAPLRRELALVRVAAVSRAPEVPDLTRFDSVLGEIGKVPAALAAVEGRLAKIEAQPLPGGPAVRALAEAAGLSVAEKTLGTAPQRAADGRAAEIAALERLAAASPGDQAVQTAIAARILSVQRGG